MTGIIAGIIILIVLIAMGVLKYIELGQDKKVTPKLLHYSWYEVIREFPLVKVLPNKYSYGEPIYYSIIYEDDAKALITFTRYGEASKYVLELFCMVVTDDEKQVPEFHKVIKTYDVILPELHDDIIKLIQELRISGIKNYINGVKE